LINFLLLLDEPIRFRFRTDWPIGKAQEVKRNLNSHELINFGKWIDAIFYQHPYRTDSKTKQKKIEYTINNIKYFSWNYHSVSVYMCTKIINVFLPVYFGRKEKNSQLWACEIDCKRSIRFTNSHLRLPPYLYLPRNLTKNRYSKMRETKVPDITKIIRYRSMLTFPMRSDGNIDQSQSGLDSFR
jgi:hypothetical protein